MLEDVDVDLRRAKVILELSPHAFVLLDALLQVEHFLLQGGDLLLLGFGLVPE